MDGVLLKIVIIFTFSITLISNGFEFATTFDDTWLKTNDTKNLFLIGERFASLLLLCTALSSIFALINPTKSSMKLFLVCQLLNCYVYLLNNLNSYLFNRDTLGKSLQRYCRQWVWKASTNTKFADNVQFLSKFSESIIDWKISASSLALSVYSMMIVGIFMVQTKAEFEDGEVWATNESPLPPYSSNVDIEFDSSASIGDLTTLSLTSLDFPSSYEVMNSEPPPYTTALNIMFSNRSDCERNDYLLSKHREM